MVDVQKIWMTDDAVHIRLSNGKEASERFADYPRLRMASRQQRNNYTFDGYGIHWPELDEDLEFDSFFKAKPGGILYQVFISHPELNASAVARRLGISQSLLAQYISGSKTPSRQRLKSIIDVLHAIGNELQDIEIPDD